jgi:hypothetical protein
LKYLASDAKDKDVKTEPSIVPSPVQSKVLTEKVSFSNDIIQENCEVTSEIPEKQPIDRQPVYKFLTNANTKDGLNEKSRSVSVDTYSKRLNTYHTSQGKCIIFPM